MSEIEERLRKLPEGERRIHDLLLTRLEAGLAQYGPWEINRDPRSMPTEALDEVIDCMHYCAVELLRLWDEADARKAAVDRAFSWDDAILSFPPDQVIGGCHHYYCPRCESWYTVGQQGSQACPQCAVADFKAAGIEPAPPILRYDGCVTGRVDPSCLDRHRHYCAGCDRWFDEHDCPRCGSALP
jgi:hypothetical protein